ncbi:extracellular solute-binding protein [Aquibacillus salsiterrae]|uniref:Extracellular solute-binding protein n=1 Tax=Aquibacillus salsiterrae TaxID=2950439 RepID=A0A9X4AGA9_9BACI|nr:extracellular solute-binding protein [Aquibacillus salsiterrae]MDC3416903.1 extracellular solute-binding protein [Aquibacillus salsiterrae]
MNKSFKKLLMVMSLLMMFGVLAACSDSETGSDSDSANKGSDSNSEEATGAAMEDYDVGVQFKAKEPVQFSMLFSDHPNYPLKDDWLLLEEIEKRTNVTFDITSVPMSDYEEKRSLLISTGDAPYIIPKTYPGQEGPFVSSGAILPVSDYIDLMPNFKKTIEDYNMEPYLEGLRQEDGKYYLLPGMHENVWPDYTLAMRTDILEELGLDAPTTWEEVEVVLEKMKEAYPDSTPFSDRFEFNSTLNIAATAFGTRAGWGLGNGLKFDFDKDEFYFAPATDGYKQMVTYFNGLVEKGLLDPESMTQEDDQAVQKLLKEQSFVINTNSQTVIDYQKGLDEKLGEGEAKMKKILMPGGPAGQVMAGSKLENGIMISAKAKDDPNFEAMMQFIDWLWYSPEGKEFAKWGVEGVTYTKDENGKRQLADDVNYVGLNPDGTKALNVDYGFSGGVFSYGGSTELLQSMMSEEELEFQKGMMETKETLLPDPPIKFNAMELEQSTLLSTPLVDYVKQNTLKFILGQRDLSEWDDYVAELEQKGMQKFVDLANKVYQDKK